MKNIIITLGEIIIGVTLFTIIIIGISGVSYQSEATRVANVKINNLQQIKP
jgi:hypothetical protein